MWACHLRHSARLPRLLCRPFSWVFAAFFLLWLVSFVLGAHRCRHERFMNLQALISIGVFCSNSWIASMSSCFSVPDSFSSIVETCDASGYMALICLSQERFVLELNNPRWSYCGLGGVIPRVWSRCRNFLREERPSMRMWACRRRCHALGNDLSECLAIGTNWKTHLCSGVGTDWTSRTLYPGCGPGGHAGLVPCGPVRRHLRRR